MGRLWLLLGVIGVVTAIESRVAVDRWMGHREYLYRPFLLHPGTNVIAWRPYYRDVQVGDRVVALNGLTFTGAAQLEQLRVQNYSRWNYAPMNRYNQYPDAPWATVHGDAQIREVDTGHAHCTCGALGPHEVVLYLIVPPLLCLLVGAIGSLALLALRVETWWVVLGVCLSLTILPVDFGWTQSFTQAADVRQWPEAWMRIPAIVVRTFFMSSWVGWLLLLTGERWRWLLASPVFAYAGVVTLSEVLWSEQYQRLLWPYPPPLPDWATFVAVGLVFLYALWRRSVAALAVAACAIPFALFPLAERHWFALPSP